MPVCLALSLCPSLNLLIPLDLGVSCQHNACHTAVLRASHTSQSCDGKNPFCVVPAPVTATSPISTSPHTHIACSLKTMIETKHAPHLAYHALRHTRTHDLRVLWWTIPQRTRSLGKQTSEREKKNRNRGCGTLKKKRDKAAKTMERREREKATQKSTARIKQNNQGIPT